MATQFNETNIDSSVYREIVQLCSDFLGSSWSSLEDVVIQPIKEGRSNRIYRCKTKALSGPNEVIVRFYGSGFLEGTSEAGKSREKEVLISYIISEKQLGPRLIGIFDGGRIEEFVQSTIPTREQYEGPSMFEILACKMAIIHSLKLPFSRRVNLDSYLISLVATFDSSPSLLEYRQGSKSNQWSEKLLNFNYKDEVDWLLPMFSSISSKIVFSHQDLNRSNILIKRSNRGAKGLERSNDERSPLTEKDPGSKVMLIDYEYSGYSYRWADIVTFFTEIAFTRWKEKRSQFNLKDYPALNRRIFFIRHYCNQLISSGCLATEDVEEETIKLVKEIDFGGMVLNLVNALWRLCHPKIDNDSMLLLWEEASFRLDLYTALKEYFVNNY